MTGRENYNWLLNSNNQKINYCPIDIQLRAKSIRDNVDVTLNIYLLLRNTICVRKKFMIFSLEFTREL